MLVECGFVRAQASDGTEYTFVPSLGRIAALGSPHEIVKVFASLHDDQDAPTEARFVLATLCEQDDPTPLIGWTDEAGQHDGLMPESEQVVIARHLMHHGCVGKARPEKGDGKYSETFNVAEFVSLARVHLGMSSADAEALSMTELQTMLDMKFPDANKPERNVPTREEYDELMARLLKKGPRSG